jgi:chorismate synthase
VRAPVRTVDTSTGEASDAPYVRSDVCAVPAAGVVAEATLAWVLADALVERFGQDRLDLMLAAWREYGGQMPARPAQAEIGEP